MGGIVMPHLYSLTVTGSRSAPGTPAPSSQCEKKTIAVSAKLNVNKGRGKTHVSAFIIVAKGRRL